VRPVKGWCFLPASRAGSSRTPSSAYPKGRADMVTWHGSSHTATGGADGAGVTHPVLRMRDHIVEHHSPLPPELVFCTW